MNKKYMYRNLQIGKYKISKQCAQNGCAIMQYVTCTKYACTNYAQPSSQQGSPCTMRTGRKTSWGKSEQGVYVLWSTTRGMIRGTYTVSSPFAPLTWNTSHFCVSHTGYRGNSQRLLLQLCRPPKADTD